MGERFPAISESQEELEELLKAERDAQVRRRLHLLVLIRSGMVKSGAAAARYLAVHRNSIRTWLLLYASGGLEKLLHIGQGIPEAEQKSLPKPVFQALQVRLNEDGFTNGYLQVQRWLRGSFDLEVPYSTIHKIVRYRLKAKLKRARPSHAKKNEAEVAAFPDRLKETVEAVVALFRRTVRLFAQDEARLGLHEGMTRRCLTAFGVKPLQAVLPRYESYWLYGAVEPLTGESLFLEMPALDAACFQAYLNEFSAAYPDSLNVMITDGAPAHTAKCLRIPDNVILVRLPPYSPELNPVERLWQDLRKWLGSGLPDSLDALKERVAEILRSYSHETLASITGYEYITRIAQSV